MGCDIHGVVERKYNGKWVAYKILRYPDVARERNYDRFAALAGVRGDGPEPKGLPIDLSDTTAMLADDWAGAGHSHSWLPLKEAAAIMAATQWVSAEDRAQGRDFYKKYPESHYFDVDGDASNYRFVFWFDN